MNFNNPFLRRRASGFAFVFLLLTLQTGVAQAGPIMLDLAGDKSAQGGFYPEIVVEITTGSGAGAKTLRKITTLDTGSEPIKLSEKMAKMIGLASGDTASVRMGPLSALVGFVPPPVGPPRQAMDSQVLAAGDIDATKLRAGIDKKVGIGGSNFDAVGMAYLSMAGLTFVLDCNSASAVPFKEGYKGYEIKFFPKGDVGIPASTNSVAVTLSSTGPDYPGVDRTKRPNASGTATTGGKPAENSSTINLDSGSSGSFITPEFAKKVTGADQKVGAELKLDQLEIGTGDSRVVLKNVKMTVKSDVDDMTIGQNVLQHFVTV